MTKGLSGKCHRGPALEDISPGLEDIGVSDIGYGRLDGILVLI